MILSLLSLSTHVRFCLNLIAYFFEKCCCQLVHFRFCCCVKMNCFFYCCLSFVVVAHRVITPRPRALRWHCRDIWRTSDHVHVHVHAKWKTKVDKTERRTRTRTLHCRKPVFLVTPLAKCLRNAYTQNTTYIFYKI